MRVRALLMVIASLATMLVPGDRWAAMRRVDERLGAIGYRLVIANAALCRANAPATGLIVHAIEQYPPRDRAAVSAAFGFEAPVAVEAVVPGSPAERAGVMAGDSLVAVAGQRVSTGRAGAVDRDAALARLAEAPVPLRLTLRRGGVEREVVVAPLAGCRVAIEAVVGGGLAARSDGKAIQVGDALVARYDDEGVAVVVAHELAHIVLGHHAALAEERSVARVRATEDEADRLSVVLLYNAGYDPGAAARFWRAHGGDVEAGWLVQRRHGSARDRTALVAGAAAAIPAGAALPYAPPGLAQ